MPPRDYYKAKKTGGGGGNRQQQGQREQRQEQQQRQQQQREKQQRQQQEQRQQQSQKEQRQEQQQRQQQQREKQQREERASVKEQARQPTPRKTVTPRKTIVEKKQEDKRGIMSTIGHGPVQEGYIGDEAFKETIPTGQHKLRSQFDRLTAKYGADFAKTSQGQQLMGYLSGVPVERGGGLGARDLEYGGGSFATKSGKINKNLEAQRQALIKRISSIGTPWGGDMSTMLEDIKREGIGADLTPDQFFNFTQQLMAADPSPGNQAYKAARPFSSGSALQGIAGLMPGMGPLKAIAKGVGAFTEPLRKAARPFTTELRKVGSGLRDAFGNLIPEGLKKDVKTLGRDARTAAGGIGDWFKFNPPAEYMGMTADPRFLSAMKGRPMAANVPGGEVDRGGVIDAAQSVVNQQSPYGGWIGQTGPVTGDVVDSDGDGIDDRYQAGPGAPYQGPGGDLAMPGFEVGQIAPMPITLPQAPFSGQTDLAASQAAGYDIPIGGGQDPNLQDWYKNLGIMQNVYS